MPEYIKPPNPVFKTIGVQNLFKVWLREKCGEESITSFNNYLASRPNAELWCSNCGTIYPLKNFGDVLDLQWILKENGKVGPMRITRTGFGTYSSTREANAVCSNNLCKEHEMPLNYLFVGNVRNMSVADFELYSLGMSPAQVRGQEIWQTTTYSKAVCCRADNSSLDYLTTSGAVIKREVKLDDAIAMFYKVNDKGSRKMHAFKRNLKENGLLKKLDEFWKERLEKLNEFIEVHQMNTKAIKQAKLDKTAKGQASIEEFPEEYKHEFTVLHVSKEELEEIWKKDREKYWGAQAV